MFINGANTRQTERKGELVPLPQLVPLPVVLLSLIASVVAAAATETFASVAPAR